MIITYSKIIGLPVAELKNQSKIGIVSDVLIDSRDCSVAGFFVSIDSWLLRKTKLLLKGDVLELLRDGVIVSDDGALIDFSESIHASDLYKNESYGINQKVITESGKSIGSVFDYLVSSQDLAITKFHTRKLLSDRLIPSASVQKIHGRVITIADDLISKGLKQTAPQTATISE